jgi:hypothetical protein
MLCELFPQRFDFGGCHLDFRKVEIFVVVGFRCKEQAFKSFEVSGRRFGCRGVRTYGVQFFFGVGNSSVVDGLKELFAVYVYGGLSWLFSGGV